MEKWSTGVQIYFFKASVNVIQELIYTSAGRGLYSGSKGYCTVACTKGMSKLLVEKLESLSGYRHIYPAGSPGAKNNPTVKSFITTRIGGQEYYIVSRVSDAGLDYSGRSNKLAHHIVLQRSDLKSASPIGIFSAGLHIRTWETEPHFIQPREISTTTDTASSLASWKRLAGDEAWADYLVYYVLRKSPVYVVYPLSVNPLVLLAEAHRLLQPSDRWRMTFSTFFTRMPPAADCLVRCLPAASAEAASILANPDRPRIDLTGQGSAPRLPTKVSAGASPSPSSPPTPCSDVVQFADGQPYERQPAGGDSELGLELAADGEEIHLQPERSRPPTLPKRLPTSEERQDSRHLTVGIAIALVMLLMSFGAYATYRTLSEPQDLVSTPPSPPNGDDEGGDLQTDYTDPASHVGIQGDNANHVDDVIVDSEMTKLAPNGFKQPEAPLNDVSQKMDNAGPQRMESQTTKFNAPEYAYYDLSKNPPLQLKLKLQEWASWQRRWPDQGTVEDNKVTIVTPPTNLKNVFAVDGHDSGSVRFKRLDGSLAALRSSIFELKRDDRPSSFIHFVSPEERMTLRSSGENYDVVSDEFGLPKDILPQLELTSAQLHIDGDWHELAHAVSEGPSGNARKLVAYKNKGHSGIEITIHWRFVDSATLSAAPCVLLSHDLKTRIPLASKGKNSPNHIKLYAAVLHLRHELIKLPDVISNELNKDPKDRSGAVSVEAKSVQDDCDRAISAWEVVKKKQRFDAVEDLKVDLATLTEENRKAVVSACLQKLDDRMGDLRETCFSKEYRELVETVQKLSFDEYGAMVSTVDSLMSGIRVRIALARVVPVSGPDRIVIPNVIVASSVNNQNNLEEGHQ